MQYLHDNLKIHIICGGKVQYPHYDHNPHYICEREMQYMHNNLKMHTIYGWQNVILAL
jgi:endo-1,4-beta-mannosidase